MKATELTISALVLALGETLTPGQAELFESIMEGCNEMANDEIQGLTNQVNQLDTECNAASKEISYLKRETRNIIRHLADKIIGLQIALLEEKAVATQRVDYLDLVIDGTTRVTRVPEGLINDLVGSAAGGGMASAIHLFRKYTGFPVRICTNTMQSNAAICKACDEYSNKRASLDVAQSSAAA